MNALNFNQKWILVTGASSGLGYEMAQQLARKYKANLIVAARRADKLNQLKTELEQQAGVQVKVVVADLSVPEDIDRLLQESLNGQQLYGAILNAGVTFFGPHADMPAGDFERLLQTNVVSVVRLTTELVKHFEQPGREGGIMVVSSMAALFPVPYQAVYSGTKAFIMSFVNALALEITNPQLSLTVYAPGGIATEMTEGEKFNDLKGWLMPVAQAAHEGLDALQQRKYNHVPGALNRIGGAFMKLMPKKFIVGQLGKTYRKSLAKLQESK
ncbi:SDR family NAD(P)-dependent oxidoreductase [Mucilaginibacter robiniae]|uniref:SDR family NAD(P)-dependent oxidoreductase n=1 Tax=Mucilaginibacter robiniae TaxID=2728022 RepID=A0A7L5DYX3_9SPHI|nr:SDR family NAD(P)-dependent oxidoreductase [Mucilaginibacter robiniae]QJD96322.1 SDR family NAD(P)-dependent oxidoreductase [Mucilaginibacter robiniae]